MNNIVPLLDVPLGCIASCGGDQDLLKKLRKTATADQGFFLVRYHHLNTPVSTFVLTGDLRYNGRWHLGRIRQHKTRKGCYEILVKRTRTCYYREVDSFHEVANEIRFFNEDADLEFSQLLTGPSEWIFTTDEEFYDRGF